MSTSNQHQNLSTIAIIGMAGRFPGAEDLEAYWENLRNGVESITFLSDQQLQAAGVPAELIADPQYVKAAALLKDVELFDAAFFGLTPREAEIMDPQHRLFLECAWEALENAGYNSDTYSGAIGVFAGSGPNTYLLNKVTSYRESLAMANAHRVLISNDKDFMPTRVSYKLNLKGPSVAVQTACSTSLVAVHMACQSLLNGECDMALAGGVRISVPQDEGYLYQEGMILSPDGHCRTFDAKAGGTVRGSGVGIVVLTRLDEALRTGSHIHAVIKGSAINNDGAAKVGYTAPSIMGQAAVVGESIVMAQIEAETVSYVEAHGTATELGDPIELAALTRAFRAHTQAKNFCAIGSVKTNIGHLDAAAGIAGLIKTVLGLEHKLLPPSLHFEQPNPQIDFANSPFYVNTRLREWERNGVPRRAGVSSFGIGGTNAHIILEEAPSVTAFPTSRPKQLLVLSAKTEGALENVTANLIGYLKRNANLDLADVAYTLQVGRKTFGYRKMVVCEDVTDTVQALAALESGRVVSDFQESTDRPIVFMFPGQGVQYVNMGLALYQSEPAFREQVDRCAELLKPYLGLDLRPILYPGEDEREEAVQHLQETYLTQPALFTIEYALAKLWMQWGVHPQAMIGHSIGEYVAACLSGVFSLEDGLRLVAARGRLMQKLPNGEMLAVPLSEAEVYPFLSKQLSLAAVNTPKLCVVAGEREAVNDLERQLAERGLASQRLYTSHAFHSTMMDSILEEFTEEVKGITLNPPQRPYLSNVTGEWIKGAEATDPRYWTEQLRRTVRWAEGMQKLLQQPEWVLLEVGPGQSLTALARRHPAKLAEQLVLGSLPRSAQNESDAVIMLNALGQLWLRGVAIDWSGFNAHELRRRVPLPTYPFERQRYWISPKQRTVPANFERSPRSEKTSITDWFYIPSWKRSFVPFDFPAQKDATVRLTWLVLLDDCGLGSQIVRELEASQQNVIAVMIAAQFTKLDKNLYALNPRQQSDFVALLNELHDLGVVPEKIVHLWSLTQQEQFASRLEFSERVQERGFYSLLFLAQALGEQNITAPMQFYVVSNNMQGVTGEDLLYPEKATVLGPCKVIPQEYSNIHCRSIDVVLAERDTWQEQRLLEQLIAEFRANDFEPVVAYRGNHRWVQTFERISLGNMPQGAARLREGGVYLITGGLGGIGLVLADYLAQSVRAKLVLTGRSFFPARKDWSTWLATHELNDAMSRKIRQVQLIEEHGGEVLVLQADVTNLEEMRLSLAQVYEHFGNLHGVIHAAGVANDGLTQLKSVDVAESVLSPKVRGTLVLDEITNDKGLDFIVLCSSLSAILGILGQVDYSAANAFLDSFAQLKGSDSRTFVISINWSTWEGMGMSANQRIRFIPENFGILRDEKMPVCRISPQEGIDIFSSVLSSNLSQIIVAPHDLSALIQQRSIAHPLILSQLMRALSQRYPRPKVASAYVPPASNVERVIAGLWEKILGVDDPGVEDDFFALGGDSLLATQIVSNLSRIFEIELPLRAIFDATTIAKLAVRIEEIVIQNIEELGDEEAKHLLNHKNEIRS